MMCSVMIKIIPALLEDDSEAVERLCAQLRVVVDVVQIDFADGTMTDRATCDLYDLVGVCGAMEIEVHLMTIHPEEYFDACATLGAGRVYFHVNEVESPSHVIDAATSYAFALGLSLSPQTRVDDVAPYFDRVGDVQVMTVVPGKQGGVFLPEMLAKVVAVHDVRPDLCVAVDGGVTAHTLAHVIKSGADHVAVGSAITRAPDPAAAYEKLCAVAEAL